MTSIIVVKKVLALFDKEDIKYIDLSKYRDFIKRDDDKEKIKCKKMGEFK